MKQCTKCGEWKEKSEFNKSNRNKDGLYSSCKSCRKVWRENNKHKIDNYHRTWYSDNRESCIKYKKSYYRNNKKHYKEMAKKWRNNNKNYISSYLSEYNKKPLRFSSKSKYRKEIELYEEVKKSNSGNLMCKCAYCGEWFEPTYLQTKNRIGAANGDHGGESRLYCSTQCKHACPTYNQSLYPKDMKLATAREVQPQLRHMVFERDNYTCQKCSTHRDNLEVGIQCHHKEGILWEPLQSADMDMCITFCEDCHKEVHGIDGCGYYEMMCA